MKKITSSIYLILAIICSFIFMSNVSIKTTNYIPITKENSFNLLYNDGSPGNRTGSPGDGGSTCTSCHGNPGNFNLVSTISTNIPLTGYVLGETYTISISTSSLGATRKGFELTAEKAGGTAVGVYNLTGATGSPQIITSGGSVTHTDDSYSSWSFIWTAPLVDEGQITFYAAVLAGAGSGSNGDQVVTITESVEPSTLSLIENNILAFDIYPNPSKDYITIKLPNEILEGSVEIFDFLGRSVITAKINRTDNKLNLSNLSEGMYIISLTSEENIGVKKFVKK